MAGQAYDRTPFSHLQIDNDILLRRSNSLRQGLPNIGTNTGRRKSSLEEIGISHFATLMQATNHSNPIKIALNGSIGLEVTPPEEPTPLLGVPSPSHAGAGGSISRHGSAVGLNVQEMNQPAIQIQQESPSPTSPQPPSHQQHLQGTIV